MEYIEVTGRTIDDALTNACLKLETTSDNIEYEVIEKGSNGLFGIFNSKPTKIKARVKAGVGSVDDEFSKLEAKEKKSIDDTIKSEIKAESKKEVVKETEKAVKKETAPKADNSKVSATQAVNASEEDLEEKANNNEPRPVLSNEEIESRIRTFLGDMFSAMDIPVEVKITFDTEEECVNVELIGENMGLLIGKRGQTLDSIQYLTSLVLNKGKEKYVRIKVDTENYRQRRKDTLESLAKNIAYKVKRSRRSVALEPMNPYERRIIYAAELVRDIKSQGDFCVGGACYPEGHVEAANKTEDILHLKEKVDAGCEFLTTQMFFDNNIMYNFLYRIREKGITVPVVAGIMPVTNVKQIKRITSMSGTYLPERFKAIVDRFGDNPAAMKQAGVIYATEQIIDLIANGVNHIHVYSMNKPEIAAGIQSSLSEILK